MSEAFLGTKLTMNLGPRSYEIILRRGALQNLYQFANLNRRVAVVTDSGVPPLYARQVADQCREAAIITVPQGEASKSLKTLESVLQQMLDAGLGRGDLVIAVGGGVVGDLAGFAAAVYMRGIDFINCPTTTLSMIDSSIGGKTAVDLGDTKNVVVGDGIRPEELIGFEHNPRLQQRKMQEVVRRRDQGQDIVLVTEPEFLGMLNENWPQATPM